MSDDLTARCREALAGCQKIERYGRWFVLEDDAAAAMARAVDVLAHEYAEVMESEYDAGYAEAKADVIGQALAAAREGER